jgi:sugar O-acyltransferase (sialic acid O-acetyltransferase NeuD family)
MRPKLLIIGAGGFGQAVAEAAAESSIFDVVGFVDDRFPSVSKVAGIAVFGGTEDLSSLRHTADVVFVAIGNNAVRASVTESVVRQGFALATIVHPRAYVSSTAKIGLGTVVMAGSVIGSKCVLGDGVIAHYASAIDHNCVIGNYSHIGVGACVTGGVILGKTVWLQTGCAVGRSVQIADGEVISQSMR